MAETAKAASLETSQMDEIFAFKLEDFPRSSRLKKEML